MVVPTLMQLSFSSRIVIVDTPVVVLGGYFNLWFGCCCCILGLISMIFWKSLQDFWIFMVRIIGIGLQHFWLVPQLCLSYHLSYYLTEMMVYLTDGVGRSLVRGTSIGGKIFDKYCLLMLSPSRFAIPRKVKLSVQILMTLDTWSVSSLPEMSLLFLRFIRVFVTSQIANAPLRTAPWTFCTFRSLLWSWALIRFCQISLLHFFTSKSEQFCSFLYVFIFVLNFSKALGFCQTLFAISARSLLIFYPISSSLSSSFTKPFRPERVRIFLWFLVGS